jgi:hypothetical protein
MPRDYRYKDLKTLLAAFNGGEDISPFAVDPSLLNQPVWVGVVFYREERYPPAILHATKRSEVTHWLRSLGARKLGRYGSARDLRGSREYELEELSVAALLWSPPDDGA